MFNYRLSAVLIFVFLALPDCAVASAESDLRWSQAEALQSEEDFPAAAGLFHQIFADHPRSQRAALRAAICEHQGGAPQDALASYQLANEVEPFGYWAEVGLYKQAQLQWETGDTDGARSCIVKLRERFPDSRWTARAEVLEAEIDGTDMQAAELALRREMAAYQLLKIANRDRGHNNDSIRLGLLQNVVDRFGDTGSALSALDTQGHIHIRNGDHYTAVEKFLDVIAKAEAQAPQSRVVQTAHTRLAGLYHAMGRKQEALDVFSRLADYGTDEAIVSNAALQSAGLYFELLQPRCWSNEEVLPDEWEEVRRLCQRVKDLGFAKDGEIARADLMILETYLWEDQPEQCLLLAEAYINDHEIEEYRRELGTAHLFAGESLLRLGRSKEALDHFYWITNEYETNGEVWPWPYLIARTYYRVFDALVRSGAPRAEQEAVAAVVLTQFPESHSAGLLRAVRVEPAEPEAATDPVVENMPTARSGHR